jgi:hypothetical protein
MHGKKGEVLLFSSPGYGREKERERFQLANQLIDVFTAEI